MDDSFDRLIPEMRRGVLQLAILSLLKEKNYGYALCKQLGESGFPIEEGTLYPILRRFEDQGMVQSIWNTEGPRPRKYFQTTRRGSDLLRRLSEEWEEIAQSLEKILHATKRS